MRIIGMIVLACLLVSAAQVVIAAIALLIILSLIWCLISRPAETLKFLAVCIVARMAATWPGTSLSLVMILSLLALVDFADTRE